MIILISEIDKQGSNQIVNVRKNHGQKCVNLSGYTECLRCSHVPGITIEMLYAHENMNHHVLAFFKELVISMHIYSITQHFQIQSDF